MKQDIGMIPALGIGMKSTKRAEQAPGDDLARIELETVVLVRHFEMLRRRSDIYAELERSEYLLLRTLEAAGPLDIAGLAARLGLDPSTSGRQVNAMVARDLVRRTPDPADRRRGIVEPTERGCALMQEVRRRRLVETDALLADWEPAERAALAGVLARYNRAVAGRYLTGDDEP
jgi:DNA-binding MarR family transcriptional regulator